jgi:hypothetical protein
MADVTFSPLFMSQRGEFASFLITIINKDNVYVKTA